MVRYRQGALPRAVDRVTRSEDRHFHAHPFHAMFSLVASFVLGVLVALMLALLAE